MAGEWFASKICCDDAATNAYRFSRITSISFIASLSAGFAEDVKTSAPDAKESMSRARREVPRFGSYFECVNMAAKQAFQRETYLADFLQVIFKTVCHRRHPEFAKSVLQKLFILCILFGRNTGGYE